MKTADIQRLLPVIFQRTLTQNSPLAALLLIMEGLHAPAESVIENLDSFFDPRRAPDSHVPYLARWLDLERLFDHSALATDPDLEDPLNRESLTPSPNPPIPHPPSPHPPLSTGTAPLRELIAIAAYLSRWRGTAKGLVLFLETALDTRGFAVSDRVVDNMGTPRPFHLEVTAPETTQVHQALIQRIIESEKPAYVTYELVFSDA